VRAPHATCIACSGSCPVAQQQVPRHLVSPCVEYAVEFLPDWWPLLLSIAILALISDLAEPKRCRSHGNLDTIREILG